MKKFIISFLCLVFLMQNVSFATQSESGSTSGISIYVSTEGDDSNDGSFEKPVKTLEHAKNMACILAKKADTDINIYVRGGTYNVGDGLYFDSDNTGTEKSSINFKAYNDEKVYVTNAQSIDGSKFKRVTDEEVLKKIPVEARESIYCVSLKEAGVKNVGSVKTEGWWYRNDPGSRMLTVDGERYIISRWPNAGFAETGVGVKTITGGFEITYTGNRGERWTTANEALVYGFFKYLWADDSIKVKEVNTKQKILTLSGKISYGVDEKKPYYIYNLIEELDMPGEWFVDSRTEILYVFPKTDIKSARITFSAKETNLINVDGAENITFTGITFENTCGNAIDITKGNGIVADNCEIRNIGCHAMRIYGTNSKNNGIKNSYIHDIGKGGIFMSTGDYATLEHGNNFVENCHIERYATTTATYVPAVNLYGIGNRVSYCEINNAFHNAIWFNGVDHVIEYNEIYDILKYSNDAGAIYGGRSWLDSTTIRYNHIHDCKGVDLRTDDSWFTQGIYLDDGLSGTQIYGNVIESANQGIFYHYANNTVVRNNILIDCETPIRLTNRGTSANHNNNHKNLSEAIKTQGLLPALKTYIKDDIYNTYVSRYMKNPPLYEQKMPWIKTVMYESPFYPMNNTFTENISIGTKQRERKNYIVEGPVSYPTTVEGNIVLKNNYHEEDTSKPLEEIIKNVPGFEPIDMSKIGRKEKNLGRIKDFKALSPLNGESDVPSSDITLVWEQSEGATSYILTVAEDANFEKVVLRDTVQANYRTLPKLKSGGQKYYWKVEGYSVSSAYEETLVPNSNGVQGFRTAKNDVVDKSRLEEAIESSIKDYEAAVEGDGAGEYLVGAKDEFKVHIDKAEKVLADLKNPFSPYISLQLLADNSQKELLTKQSIFNNSKAAQVVDLSSEIITKASDWSKKVSISSKTLSYSEEGLTAFMPRKLDSYKIFRFNAIFEPTNGSYICITVRAGNTTSQPWNTNGYAFLVKEDVIELQKFGSGDWLKSVENDCLQPGTPHEVEYGAVSDEKNVRIILKVDGREIFNILDEENPINDAGYFTIYTGKPDQSVTIW